MFNIAVRNLKIFFRDKSAVFFSLLSVLIIIGLYVVFLGDVWTEGYVKLAGIDTLMDSWIIAGIISVASITTTMGAFGIMVEDRARKNRKDFFSAPLKRSGIVGGYILSAYIVGIILSVLTFVLGEAYIVISGGGLLAPLGMLKMLGIILLSGLASSSLVFFIVSFFWSNSAYAAASTILGTLVGFLTGIYLPIGNLPEGVQTAIKLFPVSHAGALMRQVMMEVPMQVSFAGIPEKYLVDFKEMMGVIYTYGGSPATTATHIVFLLGTAVLFFFLALFNVSRKSSRG